LTIVVEDPVGLPETVSILELALKMSEAGNVGVLWGRRGLVRGGGAAHRPHLGRDAQVGGGGAGEAGRQAARRWSGRNAGAALR